MGIRTDLAMEEKELLGGSEDVPSGVRCRTWETRGIPVTEIHIENEAAATALHKPAGIYRTMEMNGDQLRNAQDACTDALSENLAQMLPDSASFLVVGLGNRAVTPDAIGPNVLRRILVTRHLASVLSELDGALRQVSSIAPGVLGETGMESAEIVRGVVARTHPECVLVIDALASARPERLCRSIQLSDSGIVPGSGVGKQQKGAQPGDAGSPGVCHRCPDCL